MQCLQETRLQQLDEWMCFAQITLMKATQCQIHCLELGGLVLLALLNFPEEECQNWGGMRMLGMEEDKKSFKFARKKAL